MAPEEEKISTLKKVTDWLDKTTSSIQNKEGVNNKELTEELQEILQDIEKKPAPKGKLKKIIEEFLNTEEKNGATLKSTIVKIREALIEILKEKKGLSADEKTKSRIDARINYHETAIQKIFGININQPKAQQAPQETGASLAIPTVKPNNTGRQNGR